jgi:branched-chain amino acid transport system permease protein
MNFDFLAAMSGQLLIGLVNGSFYAMMSLGVAVIFGMLRIANFVHGAQFMLGAFLGWFLLGLPTIFPGLGLPSVGYWPALVIVPLVIGAVGMGMEKLFISRIYSLDHSYSVLLTLGLALVIEGIFHVGFGSSGKPYDLPPSLSGGTDLGFVYLPYYRLWVLVISAIICFGTWYGIERTKLGAYLRAATENPVIVESFGINVPKMLTLTYGLGVGLAGLAGLMAAPIYQVSPQMGQSMIIVVFAIVVIGGMGSIFGAIASGFALGVIEALTKVFYPQASSTVIFVIMAIVLVMRPQGLFGVFSSLAHTSAHGTASFNLGGLGKHREWIYVFVLACIGLLAPQFLYPTFLMKVLCFALFACAYNLIFGYVGLVAFGHAAFFGAAVYVTAHTAKFWGITPEVAILLGTLVSTILGLLIGWIAIKRQGLYFAMITLALAQLVYFYAVQAPWTRGEDGLQSVPRGELFGLVDLNSEMSLYYFVLAVFLIGFAIIHRAVRSPFGQVLRAIRDNEPRAISLGYPTSRVKLMAFAMSAGFSGLAGGILAIVFQVASMSNLYFTMSAEVLLMVLIGGAGTIFGPIVGAIILVTMQQYLAGLGSWVLIVQGVTFVFCVLVLRKGVVGTFLEFIERSRQNAKRYASKVDGPGPKPQGLVTSTSSKN